MRIIKVGLPQKTPFHFSFRIWKFSFGLHVDSRQVTATFLVWYLEHDRGYKLFPPKSDFFADNTFKGRLKRFYINNRKENES